jgi:hypothetical protein
MAMMGTSWQARASDQENSPKREEIIEMLEKAY